jgi:hypothetical protein
MFATPLWHYVGLTLSLLRTGNHHRLFFRLFSHFCRQAARLAGIFFLRHSQFTIRLITCRAPYLHENESIVIGGHSKSSLL